jgi:uncharacterized membrane protein YheB (UPF0754 family)
MNNIQEIFDAYLKTRPSAEKIRSATSMMIHLGKALNVNTQEEITAEYYDEICQSLDEFFSKTPQKAILDKAILAEMIGRIGPRPKINRILKSLLLDKNENVRQYALRSLEFSGPSKPRSVIPFIEQQMKSSDPDMVTTAEYMTAKIICSAKHKYVLEKLQSWYDKGNEKFIQEAVKRTFYLIDHELCDDKNLSKDVIHKWIETYCPQIKL